jgi:hypothetical protein
LHARATVVTRQGDTGRAARLWRLLQTRQPGHREAEKMLWPKIAPSNVSE